MLQSISVPSVALAALTFLGLRAAPPSEHVNHLSMRQRPAGPVNMLPEVLARNDDLSNYTSLMKVSTVWPVSFGRFLWLTTSVEIFEDSVSCWGSRYHGTTRLLHLVLWAFNHIILVYTK